MLIVSYTCWGHPYDRYATGVSFFGRNAPSGPATPLLHPRVAESACELCFEFFVIFLQLSPERGARSEVDDRVCDEMQQKQNLRNNEEGFQGAV